MTLFSASLVCAEQPRESSVATEQEKINPALEQKIRQLITQLGDADWNKREAATAELKAIGQPAIPLLTEARNSADPEVRTRTEDILSAVAPPPLPAPVASGFSSQIIIGGRNQGAMVLQIGGAPQAQQKTVVTKSFAADGKQYSVTKTTENRATKLRVEIIEAKDGKEQKSVVEADDEKALAKKDPELWKIIQDNEGRANVQMQAVMQMQANFGGDAHPPAPASLDLLGTFGVQLRIEAEGARVTDLKADSLADKMGVKIGDLLTKANSQALGTLDDARSALENVTAETPLTLEILRGGETKLLKAP
jgi:S1-C subfamily serine protease